MYFLLEHNLLERSPVKPHCCEWELYKSTVLLCQCEMRTSQGQSRHDAGNPSWVGQNLYNTDVPWVHLEEVLLLRLLLFPVKRSHFSW